MQLFLFFLTNAFILYNIIIILIDKKKPMFILVSNIKFGRDFCVFLVPKGKIENRKKWNSFTLRSPSSIN